ncbi:hypothetical protein vseg_011732 [Gypsophila vaccaria]
MDSPAIGAKFTWNNKQDPDTRTYRKLDRMLVNQEWLIKYDQYVANFLPEGYSDPTPCIIHQIQHLHRPNRPFKYFNMLSKDDRFTTLVKQNWETKIDGTSMFQIVKHLKELKPILKKLNHDGFNDIEGQAGVMLIQLQQIQAKLGINPDDATLQQQEMDINLTYQKVAEAQKEYMQQKSKTEWIRNGDTNTSYFHGLLKGRRNYNQVLQIENQEGISVTNPKLIQDSFLKFYHDLLGTSKTTMRVSQIIIMQGPIWSSIHSQILLRPVSETEIKEVLFSIPNDKSPGHHGYTSKFFKNTWDIVGHSFCSTIKDFFETGQLLKQINATSFTLIPKVSNPSKVAQFRSISCCNVLYKCISKLLCAQLASILPDLISPTQG